VNSIAPGAGYFFGTGAANVKDFGAIGDGIADDTKAIRAAIEGTKSGAICCRL